VLCYAITELGYKTAYDIKDLLVEKEGDPFKNLYQFFTARQILTNKPVTFNDYRKLLIDIEGVKNAWLSMVDKPKPGIWLNCSKSKLMHKEEITNYPDDNKKKVTIRGLYDVLPELEEDDLLGDLNELFAEMHIQKGNEDFTILVDFPSWKYFFDRRIGAEDIRNLKFTSLTRISRKHYLGKLLVKLKSKAFAIPVNIYASKKSTIVRNSLIKQVVMKTGEESISATYLKKLQKALPIVETVFETLHAHRNLCED
jgi:hypothetical protein